MSRPGEGPSHGIPPHLASGKIGQPPGSTDGQDLTGQADVLAACRGADGLVVTQLDGIARSVPTS